MMTSSRCEIIRDDSDQEDHAHGTAHPASSMRDEVAGSPRHRRRRVDQVPQPDIFGGPARTPPIEPHQPLALSHLPPKIHKSGSGAAGST